VLQVNAVTDVLVILLKVFGPKLCEDELKTLSKASVLVVLRFQSEDEKDPQQTPNLNDLLNKILFSYTGSLSALVCKI
jgi:hypothetical protein